MRRPGVGWLVAGIVLLGAGIVVSALSSNVVWYGGIVVGFIWIVRGIYRISRARSEQG
jgi:hypothetical protein